MLDFMLRSLPKHTHTHTHTHIYVLTLKLHKRNSSTPQLDAQGNQ
jgi:hypothetical protein